MSTPDFWDRVQYFVQTSMRLTVKYFVAKFIIALIMAVIASVALALLDVPLYALIGIIIGFSNLIPIFGPWLGAIIACIIVVFFQPIYILYVLLVAIGLQVLDQFLLSPLILGRSVNLRPIVIILVVLVAGAVLGFWSLLFAVPIAACIKLAYELFYIKRDFDDGQPPRTGI